MEIKTFPMGIKTKNLPRATRFGLWLFNKGFLEDDHLSKTTSFEWLLYTGLTVYNTFHR